MARWGTRTHRLGSLIGGAALGIATAATAVIATAPPAAAASNIDRTYGVQGVANLAGAPAIQSNVEVGPDGSTFLSTYQAGMVKVSAAGAPVLAYTTNSGGGPRASTITALDVDSQGRAVTAEDGYPAETMVVRRFLSDGHPDTTFATNGVATLPTGEQAAYGPKDVEIDSQGRILVGHSIPGATSGNRCVVTRFLSTGALDTTFGTGGSTVVEPDLTYCTRLLVRSDDGVIVADAGHLMRLDPAGHQIAFGGGTSFQSTWFISDAAIRADNSVAIVSEQDRTVALLTPTGAYDTAFSGDGKDQVSFQSLLPQVQGNEPNDITVNRLGFLANGSLVGWGTNNDGLGVARWANGALDGTYGAAGRMVVYDNELPVGSTLGGGAFSNGVIYPVVSGESVTGITKITGSSVTPLSVSASPLSGPKGTVVTFTGNGCPRSPTYVHLLHTDFNLPQPTDPYVTSTIDGTFTGTFSVPPEPSSTSQTADHRYGIEVYCSATNQRTTGPSFTYTSGTAFRPVGPQRLLDTRPSSKVGPATGAPANGKIVHVPIPTDAQLGLPAGSTSSVVLSVTAAEASTPGWVTAYSCAGDPPWASNLNITEAGQTIANLVVARPSAAHEVCLYTYAATHLVVDLVGALPATSDLVSLGDARRALDTRDNHGATPAAGSITKAHINQASVAPHQPVLLNVTATGSLGGGWVTVWPCDQPRPYTSNLNLDTKGQTVANLVTTDLDPNLDVCLYTSAGTHLIVDLEGTWSVSLQHPAAPVRLLDTRPDGPRVGYTGGRPGAGQTVELQVTGRAGVPGNAAGVVLNVTATGGDGYGWVTVWPCGQPKPYTSNLNLLRAGQTVPVAVMSGLGTGGKVCLSPSVGAHLIADLTGWFPAATKPRADG